MLNYFFNLVKLPSFCSKHQFELINGHEHSNIKKAAPTEVSWLQANKYSFLVISEKNLQLLKTNKDIDTYKVLLKNQYPGKF